MDLRLLLIKLCLWNLNHRVTALGFNADAIPTRHTHPWYNLNNILSPAGYWYS